MSNETLTFTIDKKKIKADHQYADDTGRAFKDQKEGADQLKAFIRDEVVYPNMGEKQGKRFLPLILTFFFFIVTLNLLGLIPGSATSTAFFSTTVALALITFFPE